MAGPLQVEVTESDVRWL